MYIYFLFFHFKNTDRKKKIFFDIWRLEKRGNICKLSSTPRGQRQSIQLVVETFNVGLVKFPNKRSVSF